MNNKAQTFIEYTIIIGVVMAVLLAMNPLIKRGIQGMIMVVADQLGNQQKSDQSAYFNVATDGYLESSNSSSRVIMDKQTTQVDDLITYGYIDRSYVTSESTSQLGTRLSDPP